MHGKLQRFVAGSWQPVPAHQEGTICQAEGQVRLLWLYDLLYNFTESVPITETHLTGQIQDTVVHSLGRE